MLEKTTRMNQLYDMYGSLLSEKQQQYMELYYLNDFSLGEIAEGAKVSRQAVYDQIRRAESSLELFEEKMRLLEKSERRETLYDLLQDILLSAEHTSVRHQLTEQGIKILDQLRGID